MRFVDAEGALTIRLGTGSTGLLVGWQARIERGPLDGVISAFLDFDPEDARKRLQELLSPRDLTGRLYLTGSEHGEFRARVALTKGRGVLEVKVESGYGTQDGGGVLTLMTDQSHLADAVRELEPRSV